MPHQDDFVSLFVFGVIPGKLRCPLARLITGLFILRTAGITECIPRQNC